MHDERLHEPRVGGVEVAAAGDGGGDGGQRRLEGEARLGVRLRRHRLEQLLEEADVARHEEGEAGRDLTHARVGEAAQLGVLRTQTELSRGSHWCRRRRHVIDDAQFYYEYYILIFSI